MFCLQGKNLATVIFKSDSVSSPNVINCFLRTDEPALIGRFDHLEINAEFKEMVKRAAEGVDAI